MPLEHPAPYIPQALLDRLAEGDRNASTQIYTDLYPPLLRYLEVVTRSHEAAEHHLQEVFARLWHKRATLTGVRSLYDYCFRMARNQVFDERRKQDHRRAYLRSLSDDPHNHTEDQLLLKEYHALVRQG